MAFKENADSRIIYGGGASPGQGEAHFIRLNGLAMARDWSGYSETGGTVFTAASSGINGRDVQGACISFLVGSTSLQNATVQVTGGIYMGGYTARSIENGDNNIVMGTYAGDQNEGGSGNIIIGKNALRLGTTTGAGANAGWGCRRNVIIGHAAGYSSEGSLYNCTYLGHWAGGSNDTSHRVYIGNTSVNYAYCAVTWSCGSDIRDKADVTPMTHGLDLINNLNPINYSWDKRSSYWTETAGEEEEIIIDKSPVPDGSKKEENIEVGFSAQEVKSALEAINYDNHSVVNSEDPEELTLTATRLVPFLVNAVKELSDKRDGLKVRLSVLEAE